MFKIVPKATFGVDVSISVPGAAPAVVRVEFKHLPKSALPGYFSGLQGKTDAEALAEIVVGWEGVDVPYSPQALATLVDNYPAAAAELFEAFRSELMEARRKNSLPSPTA